jgi:Lrp/AsnC family transcriptional regulator for asnA, asnC and gidA
MLPVTKPMATNGKSHKVDETDRKILRILAEDGRRSFAEMAVELKLAPSTVQQRTNRLIEAGIVKILGVTDNEILGITVTATIAIKADGTRLRQIADELSKVAEVSFVVMCAGTYDLLVEVGCRDNDHLLSLISDKLAKVKGVREMETFVYLRIVKNSYLLGLTE